MLKNDKYTPLNYDGFQDNIVRNIHLFDGYLYEFKFENGYGASVIKHQYSYGGEDDLFELAILFERDIHGDVTGYLTNDEIVETLRRIEKYD